MPHELNHDAWLLRQPARAPARLRVFCFSYAGGSAAAYHGWQASLPADVEVCAVQLPGRGARLPEPPERSLALLVDRLAAVLVREDDLPFAFFGHSLGALLAFELARQLRRAGRVLPARLIVSGSVAPRRRMLSRRLHELDDAALLAALRRYNGAPAAVLDHPELMELMLPTVRADFALGADYRYVQEAPLPLTIDALGGCHDPHVPFSGLRDWQDETTMPLRVHSFEGDHFFIQGERRAVLETLRRELAQPLAVAA